MSYANNKQCQVNLLCAILSEQMITVLGQAVWLNFMNFNVSFLSLGTQKLATPAANFE